MQTKYNVPRLHFKNNGLQKVTLHHVPKTGGSSIKRSLFDVCDGTTLCHKRDNNTQSQIKNLKKNGVIVIASTRNPFTRFISAWNYIYAGGCNNHRDSNAQKIITAYGTDINDFIHHDDCLEHTNNIVHFIPMYKFIQDFDNYSYICKTETLNDDIKNIGNMIGVYNILPIKTNVHNNKNNEKFLSNLDVKSINILSEIYYKDFMKFNYEIDI